MATVSWLLCIFPPFILESYLLKDNVYKLCSKIPIVDNYGQVIIRRNGVVVPANGSKWVELIGSNLWSRNDFVELGEEYIRSLSYFGSLISAKDIVSFLRTYVGMDDIPRLPPPNAAIPTLSSPLTKTNAFLLLNWIRNLRTTGATMPVRFLSSIKEGSWLKISLSGSPGYRPPSESFMLESYYGHLYQNGSVLVDIPLVDIEFYGDEIKKYKEELKYIGVRFENKEVCEYIGEHLMSLAASSKLTRENFFSILKFIRYMGENYLSRSSVDFINSIKGGKWLRTSQGEMIPKNSVLFSQEWNAASQICDIPFIDQDYYGKEILSYKRELSLLGVVVEFNQNCYQLVSDSLKSSSSLVSLSSDAFILILTCIQKLESSDKLVLMFQNNKCLKTNLGYRCPSESFLLNSFSNWICLLEVFGSSQVIDDNFYGVSIFFMANELKKLGVMTEFSDVTTEFTRIFKRQASLSSIKKENVFSFLESYRKLKITNVFSLEFMKCIQHEKWLRTKLGDYRAPNKCILFSKDWEPISLMTWLPFIDDSHNFYGSRIHDYRVELKQLGVITDVQDGAKFVAAGFFLPQDCSIFTPVNVYALLDSVKTLRESKLGIPAEFLEKLSQRNWLKTSYGYKRPDECVLFYAAFDPFLKSSDGPFIDEEFYGSRIRSYKTELDVLGVITCINKGCQLLATYLNIHSSFVTIGRIYNYLSEFNWEPVDEDNQKIWIPRGTENGEWVAPQDCVIHDKSNLFGNQLNVLEKFKYEKKILDFFASIFNVKVHPSVDDYCDLWKKWETSGREIQHAKCCAFWEFVIKHWNSKTEEIFNKNLSKLPVLDPTSNRIFLSDKRTVFIGDDLFLMDLFQDSSRPIFLWYPQTSQAVNRTKFVDIYSKLGVRTISDTAQKRVSDVDHVGLKPINSKETIIKKGLLKLILGFLGDPKLKLEAARRHEAVSRVLAIEAFETPEPMTIRYTLSLSFGNSISVEAKRMILWDKQNSKFFMQKMDKSSGLKKIEYASHFAEVISEGVLWDNEEHVPQLSELIRQGFLVEFDVEAVEFLMKIKNLQIFLEDQDFLSLIFSS